MIFQNILTRKRMINLARALVYAFAGYLYILFGGDNVFNSIKNNGSFITSLTPQGYAFFTKNPREPYIYLYKVNENQNLVRLDINSSDSEMMFGLSRVNRRSCANLGSIFTYLNGWKDYNSKEELDANVLYTPSDTVEVSSADVNIESGVYFFVREKKVPWAWSKNYYNALDSKYKCLYIKNDN